MVKGDFLEALSTLGVRLSYEEGDALASHFATANTASLVDFEAWVHASVPAAQYSTLGADAEKEAGDELRRSGSGGPSLWAELHRVDTSNSGAVKR